MLQFKTRTVLLLILLLTILGVLSSPLSGDQAPATAPAAKDTLSPKPKHCDPPTLDPWVIQGQTLIADCRELASTIAAAPGSWATPDVIKDSLVEHASLKTCYFEASLNWGSVSDFVGNQDAADILHAAVDSSSDGRVRYLGLVNCTYGGSGRRSRGWFGN
jgi:hypothetical protein